MNDTAKLKEYLVKNNIANSINKSSLFVEEMTSSGLTSGSKLLESDSLQIESKVALFIDVIIDYYHHQKELIVEDGSIDYDLKASGIKTNLNNTKNLIVNMLKHLDPQVSKIISKSKVQDLFAIANVNLFDENMISRKVSLGQLIRNNGSTKHFKITKKNITSQLSILIIIVEG